MIAIEEIDTFQLTDGLPHVIVRIRDSEGSIGFGECWWGIPTPSDPKRGGAPIAAAVEHLVKPQYLGKSIDHVESLWHGTLDQLYRYGDGGIVTMALSGVDMALWDLNARRSDASVLELLGGSVHEKVLAYASFPPLRTPERIETETKRAIEHGYQAIKLHELESELVAITREVGGKDLAIMVDVNGHFDLDDAIAFSREISKHNVFWFEEPVRPMRDLNQIKEVADQTEIPIAAGENEYSLSDFQRMIDCKAVQYLQPEITKIGGVTPAVKVGNLTEEANVALCPHNFRGGLPLYASLHWGFSNSATEWFEIPWLPENMQFASKVPNPEILDGYVKPPQGPGLGVTIELQEE